MNHIIAIKDVCAWPNLLSLPGGELVAILFNSPSHGLEEGSLECWSSSDGGNSWRKKGIAAPHEAGKNRMHAAFGINQNGDLFVLSTGFELIDGKLGPLQRMWCSRSSDGGNSWEVNRSPGLQPGQSEFIPYGKIICLEDLRMQSAVYLSEGKGRPSRTWLLQSKDQGKSW